MTVNRVSSYPVLLLAAACCSTGIAQDSILDYQWRLIDAGDLINRQVNPNIPAQQSILMAVNEHGEATGMAQDVNLTFKPIILLHTGNYDLTR